MSLYKKLIISTCLILVLVFSTLFTWLYSQVESALPVLDGKKTLLGLSSPVTVARDDQGIPTFTANGRIDIAIATGFVHAQERFFQMDLLRRNSAGELSSLFGLRALELDKSIRLHRFRSRARTILKQLPQKQQSLIQAYTRGVNQGLRHLKAAPFEYLFLQQDPVEWQEEDTILTVFSMYIDLQDNEGQRERSLGILKSVVSNEVFDFLTPKGSIWDAAIDNSTFSAGVMPKDVFSSHLKTVNAKPIDTNDNDTRNAKYTDSQFPGSNNFAVSGNISKTGSAIVANDMHLGIRVPNTWFRASFEYTENNNPVKITGLSLPGTPNIIVGSNGYIAWGFTNSYGDWSDIIVLETSHDKTQYLTPKGFIPFELHKHIIAVKGQDSVEITTKDTIWGPIIGTDKADNLLAYRWVAHDIEAVNFSMTQLETTKTVKDAFKVAASSGLPAQNMVVGDTEGNIGWTIMGPIPIKSGDLGDIPKKWSDGDNNWLGYLSADKYPQIINPVQQRLWTANSRVVGGNMYNLLGNGGYALGARALQIKNGLMRKSVFDEKDLLEIALDDKAVFLQRWQKFLLDNVLTDAAIANHTQWQLAKDILKNDNLRASTDSVAYRIIRNFRLNVRNVVFKKLQNDLNKADNDFAFDTLHNQIETPLWQLVNEQPENLSWLPENNWQSTFNQAFDEVIDDMTMEQPLDQATWGQQNISAIHHPLSNGVPFIGAWLNMPDIELAGDSYMPRVQGKTFGASQRMIVSPGHEASGILHMPTSQAGHPWSPYYHLGHSDWANGKASPFLPSATKYTLTLLNY
jgi:penicillin amidase